MIPFIFLSSIVVLQVGGEEVYSILKEKVYEPINVRHRLRQTNATHQIGSSSRSFSGDVGVLYVVDDEESLNWLLKKGPYKPYIVLISPEMFKRDPVMKLKSSGKLIGMIVDHSNLTDRPIHSSPATKCPNQYYSYYEDNKNCLWNPHGTSLMFEDFPFLLLDIVNKDDIKSIKDCYEMFNKPSANAKPYPQCGLELMSYMYAIKSTPHCLSRQRLSPYFEVDQVCDPMGMVNLFDVIGVKDESQPALGEKSVIVVSAMLDNYGLFSEAHIGADSVVSGLVTALAAVEALGKVKEDIQKSDKLLLFQFLHGEVYDYMGSERWLYDMDEELFSVATGTEDSPESLKWEHLDSFIEVSQLGKHGDNATIYLHSDSKSRADQVTNKRVKDILDAIETEGAGLGINVKVTDMNIPLPIASLQRVLKWGNLPGVVLSNFDKEFVNRFYGSVYDNAENIDDERPFDSDPNEETREESYSKITPGVTHLTLTGSLLAKSLYRLATGKEAPSSVQANETTVSNLLFCFLRDSYCELLQQSVTRDFFSNLEIEEKPLKVPLSGYVGARYGDALGRTVKSIEGLLGKYLGEEVEAKSEEDCNGKTKEKTGIRHLWIGIEELEDTCVKTTSFPLESSSPAFKKEGYKWKSRNYTSWAESVWNDGPMARLFLIPPKATEWYHLAGGLLTTAASFLVVYIIEARADILFPSQAMSVDGFDR